MIKKQISNLSTPKVLKKQSYSNKGSVTFKAESELFCDASPKPGMGKGKARGTNPQSWWQASGVY